ncbi:MAG: serine acetyltransferase [Bacteroidales bacterium]|nr:serine acetyltransferase [Bacteroidales bacterium]
MAINMWDKLSMQLYGEITKDNEYIPLQEDESLDTSEIAEAVELFRSAVFTGYFRQDPLPYILSRFGSIMSKQIAIAFREEASAESSDIEPEALANSITEKLLASIPELKRILSTDVKAVFDGDPAAKSYREVILCYPSMVAISNYRLAHALLGYHVPIIPRIITEMSHSKTGIDIHPGATIGEYFSIDHGTGVVIGETCIIGSHVRLYQGVTLGAKSFKFDSEGNPVNEPRHPILEDNVTVYSNASILGRITIGHDTTIGGNIWQTASVPPYSKVLQGRATISSFEDGGGI